MKERCLVLIKPDALEKRITGVVVDRLERLELDIVAAKTLSVTEDLIRKHYVHLAGKPFLESTVRYMMGDYNHIANHKIIAFVFQGENAVSKIRTALGATNPENASPWTIRGSFGKFDKVADVVYNCVHASDSPEDAEREIALWFSPAEVLDA
ncbi:MAG: nucleoside-diphosphate kinase [Elusimicrobiaceae bacterium]|nr:nucleoside-diphosphate kinase [Elusimicrobiaceae bacterium]